MKILLIEDEIQLCESLVQLLMHSKYNVDAAHDGVNGLHLVLTNIYDVIILDISLPFMNGLDVMTRARQRNISTPILLLTAKGEPRDIIAGLDHGADDYLAKPFDPGELLARVRALIRRKSHTLIEKKLYYSDISLDLTNYRMECRHESVKLSRKEFEIMYYFMLNPERLIGKERLVSRVWSLESNTEYNNIEVYISFLRKKLAYLSPDVVITTLRGRGYKLEQSHD